MNKNPRAKMRNIFGLLILSFLMSPLWATSFKSQNALIINWQKSGQELEFHLKDGFHFNLESPLGAMTSIDPKSAQKPNVADARYLKWKLDQGVILSAKVYVCDNANTFCEFREFTNPQSDFKDSKSGLSKNAFLENPENTPENTPEIMALRRQAKAQNKLILIKWQMDSCPPCHQYEAETLNTPEFKKLAKKLVFSRMQRDDFKMRVVGKAYGVNIAPTMLILNSEGQEVSRHVGFLPVQHLTAFIERARKDPRAARSFLAPDTPPTYWNADRLMGIGEYQAAIDMMKKMEPVPYLLAEAEVELASRESEQKGNEARKKWIRLEPNSTRSAWWLSGLIYEKALTPEEISEFYPVVKSYFKTVQTKNGLKSVNQYDRYNFVNGDERLLAASIQYQFAKKVEPDNKVPGEQLSQVITEMSKQLKTEYEVYLVTGYLSELNKQAEIEKVLKSYLKKHPKRGPLLISLADSLIEQGRYEEAEKYIAQAKKYSFGVGLWRAVMTEFNSLEKTADKDVVQAQLGRFLDSVKEKGQWDVPSWHLDQLKTKYSELSGKSKTLQ